MISLLPVQGLPSPSGKIHPISLALSADIKIQGSHPRGHGHPIRLCRVQAILPRRRVCNRGEVPCSPSEMGNHPPRLTESGSLEASRSMFRSAFHPQTRSRRRQNPAPHPILHGHLRSRPEIPGHLRPRPRRIPRAPSTDAGGAGRGSVRWGLGDQKKKIRVTQGLPNPVD